MDLVQSRIVTDDVERLAAFYARLVRVAVVLNDYYVEVPTGAASVGFSRRSAITVLSLLVMFCLAFIAWISSRPRYDSIAVLPFVNAANEDCHWNECNTYSTMRNSTYEHTPNCTPTKVQ